MSLFVFCRQLSVQSSHGAQPQWMLPDRRRPLTPDGGAGVGVQAAYVKAVGQSADGRYAEESGGKPAAVIDSPTGGSGRVW